MAESRQQKALRYVSERRLQVTFVADTAAHGGRAPIKATCRGDSGAIHQLGYRADKKKWACTCPANAQFNRECAHIAALKLVTVAPA